MGTGLAANFDLYAGDTDWLVKLSDMANGINHADGGAIGTRPVGGTNHYEAGFVQHINSVTVPVMEKTSRLAEVQSRTSGQVFVINRTDGYWYGGPCVLPSDDRSVATGGRLTFATTFGQGKGDWYDGAPSGNLTRVRRVNLTQSNLLMGGLALDPETDNVLVLLETSADASLHIGQGGNVTTTINVTPGAKVVDLGSLSALGTTAFTDGVLSGNGITGNEALVGWLLAGPKQAVT